jgi:hypothetical protein
MFDVWISVCWTDTKKLDTKNINGIKSNKDKSRYALHVLQENQEYGPIDKIMNILKLQSKGKHLDVYEQFYIYEANKQKSIMTEEHV